MSNAIFYHAGCPVCVAAEQRVALALDPTRYRVEVVHLGEAAGRVSEAESLGVQSVPAVLVDGKLADCCAGRGPTEAALRHAGVGQRTA